MRAQFLVAGAGSDGVAAMYGLIVPSRLNVIDLAA
jgi:hypothetical protein